MTLSEASHQLYLEQGRESDLYLRALVDLATIVLTDPLCAHIHDATELILQDAADKTRASARRVAEIAVD